MGDFDGARYYHSIPGLLVPKGRTNEDVHTLINDFIDTAPGLTATLEDSFLNIDSRQMIQVFKDGMDSLIALLQGVYARGLETEATRLLRQVTADNLVSAAEKNFRPFITDILSLSVSMQKAQAQSEKGKQEQKISKIEAYTTTAKNISAVSNLMDDGLYDPAKILLGELAKHHPETSVFLSLLNFIEAGKHDEAKKTIAALKDKFNETLTALAGTDLSKKILAVDDVPDILSFVNNALKSHYKVIAVPGAKMALKVMESQKPDLFILDIDMPEMDGFELAFRIRQMPEHVNTPIIFLTGNSSREYINNATMAGGNEFIVKPASHDYLLTKVGGFLNA
ncbi:MAG: response regulator [Defluviitaleaceae bacterium]|nr:response regulator [Defluviitaleaceae bacterium]